jgi:hypothetical protein
MAHKPRSAPSSRALSGWLGRAVSALGGLMPLGSPALCMGLSLFFLLTAFWLVANFEYRAKAVPVLAEALAGSSLCAAWLSAARWLMGLGAGVCALVFQARCAQICHPGLDDPRSAASRRGSSGRMRRWAKAFPRLKRKRHGMAIAGMPVGLDDLRTSILVTGVTGSSKTAGVLLPALAQLFETYNQETEGEFEKIGGFIPEVKGDLVDCCLFLAHEAGRCISRDFVVISPASRIPVVRYRDERGRRWHLCGRGGAGGSEAGSYLPRLTYPPGHPSAGRIVTSAFFEEPADVAAVLPEWSRIWLPLGKCRPRFVGWRWEGGRLARVSHTEAKNLTVPLTTSDGARIWADPPAALAAEEVAYVDNGVHFNLVDLRLPPSEAAERLTRLASMARGSANRGENDYFYEQGRKVIGACIALHRAVDAAPCTAADIVRLATQDARLGEALDRLEARIEELAEEGSRDPEKKRLVSPLRDLALFFRDEWQKMVADGRTATVIKSTISAAFDVFLQDPNLSETFCRPSTFSFEDAANCGKILALVPGDRYEQLGRLLGTACKMDFQSAMLSRGGRAELNRSRLVLYFADECHKYVVSGSAAAGDPYFMNLSRSNNVVNICATQSYAWIAEVIGREAASVYLAAFGVQFWLQQTDPETCRRAAEICGTVTREKVAAEHDITVSGLFSALENGRGLLVRRKVASEDRNRFRPEDFAHLDVGDVVAYNKGRPGRAAKVVKGRASYHFCTEKPAGAEAVNMRVREYYRELMENLAHERGETARWDCEPPPICMPISSDLGHSEEQTTPAITPGDSHVGREEDEAGSEAALPPEPYRALPLAPTFDDLAETLSGIDPLEMAILLEGERLRAEKCERPAEAFGLALSLGAGGLASEDCAVLAPISISPSAANLPYSGNLATLVGEQARRREVKRKRGAQCR